ncbi:beta-lactamase-like protein [Lineolata rhizophorae]|uniref:Beta-lactamase-like protein n=1 Tax=Lineolata rhizophorae TaxID=578093 RepID=A0A6A6PEL8_9PEZI|nr:beta-lactamase-like protein [Lineolata rhizophorae]
MASNEHDNEPALRNGAGSVQVHLLDGGSLSTADEMAMHEGAQSKVFRMYNWCFHVYHPGSGRHIMWDLGNSSDREDYTPWVQNVMFSMTKPVGPRCSLVDQLKDIGVDSSQIDTVVFSHAHWDHCRPIHKEFPQAKAFFGPGTRDFCSPGHIRDGKPDPEVQWDGRIFGDDATRTMDWGELQGPWVEWASFNRAMDFFGDGSFWVMQAPGHMPGNMCAAAKLQDGGEWVVLGSDCCHSSALLLGKAQIAKFKLPNGSDSCLHSDLDAARDTISRLRGAQTEHGMHVALAHDKDWMQTGDDAVLMSLLSASMKGEWLERVRSEKEP